MSIYSLSLASTNTSFFLTLKNPREIYKVKFKTLGCEMYNYMIRTFYSGQPIPKVTAPDAKQVKGGSVYKQPLRERHGTDTVALRPPSCHLGTVQEGDELENRHDDVPRKRSVVLPLQATARDGAGELELCLQCRALDHPLSCKQEGTPTRVHASLCMDIPRERARL